jgi:hypothetical protein
MQTALPTVFPDMLQGIQDDRPSIPIVYSSKGLFDGEMIADAHKFGNPALQIEVRVWLTEKLHNICT